MTTPIESVTMFKCPETGKLYKTKRGAENSAKRVRDERELQLLATKFDPSQLGFQRDYVRLNATSPEHIIKLVIEKAEEFWGLKIVSFKHGAIRISYNTRKNYNAISFGNCEIDVDSDGSCLMGYLKVHAKLNKNSWYTEPSISDLLFNGGGFNGIETGSGCPGRCSNEGAEGYSFKMNLNAWLEEFPIIHKRYQEWEANRGKYYKYISQRDKIKSYGILLARSQPEYDKLVELRDYYNGCEKVVALSIKDLEDYYTNGLVYKWDLINKPVARDLESWEMFDR